MTMVSELPCRVDLFYRSQKKIIGKQSSLPKKPSEFCGAGNMRRVLSNQRGGGATREGACNYIHLQHTHVWPVPLNRVNQSPSHHGSARPGVESSENQLVGCALEKKQNLDTACIKRNLTWLRGTVRRSSLPCWFHLHCG